MKLAREVLIAVSATLATRDPERIRAALLRAAAVADTDSVDEVLLQSHLFIGFPDALNAISAWRALREASPASSGEECEEWTERGERVCATVYAGNYGRLRENVARLHPDLDRWMVDGGYGRVIGRGGLSLATRELCIAALLAAWNVPRQLHSHLRGALNAGASVHDVDTAVRIACELVDDPDRRRGVTQLWQTIRAAAAATDSPSAHPLSSSPASP